MSPGEFRLRIRYGKRGRLRWLSHLEVVHALERSVRRAGLPFAITKGFNPHLKAAFGPALPVGTAGDNEYLDVWLREYTEATRSVALLKAASAEDLAPSEARYVEDKAPSLTAVLTIGVYRVEVFGEGLEPEEVQEALARVVSVGELAVVNKGKRKVFDLARCVPKDVRVGERDGGVVVELATRMGPEGSLRPETLIRSAIETTRAEVSALHTTRLDTLVESDEGVWLRPL